MPSQNNNMKVGKKERREGGERTGRDAWEGTGKGGRSRTGEEGEGIREGRGQREGGRERKRAEETEERRTIMRNKSRNPGHHLGSWMLLLEVEKKSGKVRKFRLQ